MVGEIGGKIQAAYKALEGSILKWVWKFNMPQNCQEGLFKHALLDLIPTVSDSVDLWLGPRICIPNKAGNGWGRRHALRSLL